MPRSQPDAHALRAFAHTYLHELVSQPHRAMTSAAKVHGISRATANRWVLLARQAGYLPEAEYWVARARRRDLLAVICEVAQDYHNDATLQDAKRRSLAIMWLASRGDLGVYDSRHTPAEWVDHAVVE